MRKPFNGNYPLTQGFGENPANYAQFGLQGHNGLDYACPTGTRILAPHSGFVVEATNDASGYGLYLKIENDQEGSVLAHNANFLVKVGDSVSEGQEIAISDNTGNSTGAHCHWGYYRFPRDRQNGYAGFIDQLPLLINQPTPPLITEQSKFDFGAPYGSLEMQQVRAMLQAKDQTIQSKDDRIQSLDQAISDIQASQLELSNQIDELKKQTTLDRASTKELFTALSKHLFG